MSCNLKKKVIILQLSRLGDLLQSTVLFNSLKKSNYHITVVGDEKNQSIANEIDLIDKFIPLKIGYFINLIKLKKIDVCYKELEKEIKKINEIEYDLLINLNHSNINLFLSKLISAKRKKGFLIEKNLFTEYIYSLFLKKKRSPFNLVDVFNYFFDKWIFSKHLFINLTKNTQDEKFLEKILKEKNIVLHLGAGHPLRVWGIKEFIELGKLLIKEFNANIILTGVKEERDLGKQFIQGFNSRKKNIVNLIGKTKISLLKNLLKKVDYVISTDTGLLHLAAACNTKIISLFYCSAYPFETGPYTKNAFILAPNIECYPCFEFKQFCKDIKCKYLINSEDILMLIKFFEKKISKEKLIEYFNKEKNRINIFYPEFDKFGFYLKSFSVDIDMKSREKGLQFLDLSSSTS